MVRRRGRHGVGIRAVVGCIDRARSHTRRRPSSPSRRREGGKEQSRQTDPSRPTLGSSAAPKAGRPFRSINQYHATDRKWPHDTHTQRAAPVEMNWGARRRPLGTLKRSGRVSERLDTLLGHKPRPGGRTSSLPLFLSLLRLHTPFHTASQLLSNAHASDATTNQPKNQRSVLAVAGSATAAAS